MPAMTIRKLSEVAVQGMKTRAKANGRSVEAEARLVLESAFAPQSSFKSAWEVVEEFKTAHGGGFELPYVARTAETVEPADFE
jgi:plasmid stability protein